MGLPKGDYIAGKRRAHLALVCMLLRVYFRLNNIQGCTQVAKTITNIYGQRTTDTIDLRVRGGGGGGGGEGSRGGGQRLGLCEGGRLEVIYL